MTYEETKLSVIIVNYNVKYFLEQCLYSVRAAVTGMDAEVFVVDNNSTDGSVEYLRPKFPEVVFIENKDNPGFAKANNQAIRQCTGEYVLLLNPIPWWERRASAACASRWMRIRRSGLSA